MKKAVFLALALLIALALPACDVPGATTQVPPTPTPTLSPSPTPEPTPSPSPEPTPSPTPTPSPSPSPTPPPVTIKFKDKIVEKVIRKVLNRPDGTITSVDMASVTSFVYDPVNDKSATGTIRTLEDLRYCVNLSTLRVLHQPVSSLEGLRELDQLTEIVILGCSVSDLSPLAGKDTLRKVWISGNPVTDASPVLSLPNLQEFNAYYGTGITDISALTNSGSLRSFYCQNILKDYTPLLRQKNLQNVTLSGVSDEFFRQMLNECSLLRSICLDHSNIRDESLSLLKGRVFYNLYFERCGLKDISALADIQGVTDLRLGNNKIEDISALEGLNPSYVVDLRYNKIKDLSPLAHMTRLENLIVSGNPYKNKSVLDALEKEGVRVVR